MTLELCTITRYGPLTLTCAAGGVYARTMGYDEPPVRGVRPGHLRVQRQQWLVGAVLTRKGERWRVEAIDAVPFDGRCGNLEAVRLQIAEELVRVVEQLFQDRDIRRNWGDSDTHFTGRKFLPEFRIENRKGPFHEKRHD
jgi:hypothetical protein